MVKTDQVETFFVGSLLKKTIWKYNTHFDWEIYAYMYVYVYLNIILIFNYIYVSVCMYAYVRDVRSTGYTDLVRPPLAL